MQYPGFFNRWLNGLTLSYDFWGSLIVDHKVLWGEIFWLAWRWIVTVVVAIVVDAIVGIPSDLLREYILKFFGK